MAAPRQRNTAAEKAQIKAGRKAREIWKDKPNKAAQKDTDARWTVKIGRPRDPDAKRSVPELAIAVFGYKTHVVIDRTFWLHQELGGDQRGPARWRSAARNRHLPQHGL